MKVKVYNIISNNGNPIANQFEIYTDEGRYFQSYKSIIVFGCSRFTYSLIKEGSV